MTDVIVVGGGFNGIYAAWSLARGGAKVLLVERAGHLGGIMWSSEWRGFRVDAGAQALDLRRPELKAFFTDILDGDLKTNTNFIGSSTTGGAIHTGIEYPDFSDDVEFSQTSLAALVDKATKAETLSGETYEAYLYSRYGNVLGERMIAIAAKWTAAAPSELSPSARQVVPALERVKLGTDVEMASLKAQQEFFDDRLAVSNGCDDTRFLGTNVNPVFGYPSSGGLQTFCRRARTYLATLGVQIEIGVETRRLIVKPDEVEAHFSDGHVRSGARVFWTLSEAQLDAALDLPAQRSSRRLDVSIDLHMFEVNINDIVGPDYVNNFIASHTATRFSASGLYSEQVTSDGTTFVLAEVPTRRDSSARGEIDAHSTPTAGTVLNEMKESGFLKSNTMPSHNGVQRMRNAYSFELFDPTVCPEDAVFKRPQIPRVLMYKVVRRGRSAFVDAFEGELREKLLRDT